MESIKPIETFYNGYRFRSRLEARWAVFFDSIGLKYVYEPEGFKAVSHYGETFCYLPDFYFPENGYYGEVKGQLSMIKNEAKKLAWCINNNATPIAKGIIILGQIPYWNEDSYTVPLFPFLKWRNGIVLTQAFFGIKGIYQEDTGIWDDYSSAPELPSILFEYPEEIRMLDLRTFINVDGMLFEMDEDYKASLSQQLREAFLNASRARFEFGETPIIRRTTT